MLIQEDLAAWKVALREVVGAGEPLNPEIIERVRAAWGLTIRDGYGQTETTAHDRQFAGPEASSPARWAGRCRAIASRCSTRTAREQQEGEICLALDPRPLGLMQGYQGDDGEMQPLDGECLPHRRRRSRDDDGYFTYVGRADDVFKSSDYRISPFELESVLIEHPAVAEAAVVPSPDPLRLAVPKAFIALAPGHPPDRDTALSIFRHCAPARALQARAPPRIRRAAENHLRARSAASNCAAPKPPAGAKTAASRANFGKKISPNSDEGWTRRLSRGTL